MMDHVRLVRIGAVRVDENIFAGLRQHDDRIGAIANAPRDLAVFGGRFRQHGVQGSNGRLFEPVQKIEEPRTVRTTEEAILVLNVDEGRGMFVCKFRSATVRSAIFLREAGNHAGLVITDFSARLVNCDHATRNAELLVEAIDHVLGECGDAALARRKRSDE